MRFIFCPHHRLSRMGGSYSGSHTWWHRDPGCFCILSYLSYVIRGCSDVTGRERILWDTFLNQFVNGLHHLYSCFMGQNSGIWPLTYLQGRLGKMDASRVPRREMVGDTKHCFCHSAQMKSALFILLLHYYYYKSQRLNEKIRLLTHTLGFFAFALWF